MISYFPTPYRDELVYSIVARYKDHTNSPRSKTLLDLFSSKRFKLNLHACKKLQVLVKQIEWLADIDEDELIQKHTIYPFITAFSPIDERERIYNSLLGGKGKIICGSMNAEKNTIFKYCPECVREDRDLFGETFWRRCHNVPFVRTCLLHKCKLTEISPPFIEKHILSAESAISTNSISSHDIFPENLDQQCISVLLGNSVDVNFIISKFFATGLVKTAGCRSSVKPNGIKDLIEFIDSRYPYLSPLHPIIPGQLHQIVNGKWKGLYPTIILVLEEFLRNNI